MKKGELIGIGNDLVYGVNILAEVSSWNGRVLTGLVLNGNWEFNWDTFTGELRCYEPGSSYLRNHVERCNWVVVFRGPIPKHRSASYNDIMEYMDEHLGKHVFTRWWLRMIAPIHTHYLKLKKACGAFLAVYSKPKKYPVDKKYIEPYKSYEEEEDDSIPF